MFEFLKSISAKNPNASRGPEKPAVSERERVSAAAFARLPEAHLAHQPRPDAAVAVGAANSGAAAGREQIGERKLESLIGAFGRLLDVQAVRA